MKILETLVIRPAEIVKDDIFTSNRKFVVHEWASFFILVGRAANIVTLGRTGITSQRQTNIEGTYPFLHTTSHQMWN